MKAMILAAGLGTRLQPLTNNKPKALVEVEGRPLLQHALEHLKEYGIREVIINLHHFPEMIRDFIHTHDDFGMDVSYSDESNILLDTGGALKKAAWFFTGNSSNDLPDTPFVVRNVDVISDLNLNKMLEFHHDSHALATLAVRDRKTSRYLLFDNHSQLSGWTNKKTGEEIISRKGDCYKYLAFSGIQVLDPAIFPLIQETGSFSLIPLYLRLSYNQKIMGYHDDQSRWFDAGKYKDLRTNNLS
jgi:NDP-sugar pyrophosphorylase family protein